MNKQTEDALKLLKEYNAWRRDSEGKLQIPDPTEIGLALDCVIEALEQPAQSACKECLGFNKQLADENDSLEDIEEFEKERK